MDTFNPATVKHLIISLFNKNDHLEHFNFGVHDMLWLKIVKESDLNL